MIPSTLDQLCRDAQAGDSAALEGLVRGLQHPLYRLALRFLSYPEAARDATQEILILVVTQLSTFRGESAVTTWAYSIATRHLVRQRKRNQRDRFESLERGLGQAENYFDAPQGSSAEQRILEEEVFLGCTQAMLRALEPGLRMAFVVGAIFELEAPEAARVLQISEVAFRKRLSRARKRLDSFLSKNCGVANPDARCRCAYQIRFAIGRGRLDPEQLRYAEPTGTTTLEALRAFDELRKVRRSLELYRAQPQFRAREDFAERLKEMLKSARTLTLS
jgi:RNA polymerase sigma factor (sigma-70 family)